MNNRWPEPPRTRKRTTLRKQGKTTTNRTTPRPPRAKADRASVVLIGPTRENEELKRQIAGQPVKPQDKPSEPAKPAAAGKPKLEAFNTLEEYQEALTDWKLDERERLHKESQARTAQEEAVRKEQDGWAAKEKAARKAHDDYDDLMATVQIPAGPGVMAARQAMLEDEHGRAAVLPGEAPEGIGAYRCAVTSQRSIGYRQIV